MSSNERKDPLQSGICGWRFHAPTARRGDITLDYADGLNELVMGDWLHIEQVDDDSWQMRIGDVKVMVNSSDTPQSSVDITRGFYAPINGTTGRHPSGQD